MDVRSVWQRRKSQGGDFNCVAPRCSSRNQTVPQPPTLGVQAVDAVAPEVSLPCGSLAALCLVKQSNVAACLPPIHKSLARIQSWRSALHALNLSNGVDNGDSHLVSGFCLPPTIWHLRHHGPFRRGLRCAMRSLIFSSASRPWVQYRGCVRLVGRATSDGLQAHYLLPWLPCSNLFSSCRAVIERGLLLPMPFFFFTFL